MKVVTVIGARPQFIKAAVVRRAIQAFNKSSWKGRIREILVHTGQHYDDVMDGVFFRDLELPKPEYHLGVGSGSHGRQTALMLDGIEVVLRRERPEVVLVYGDTNSTLAGALASAKLHIPVAHVEAGLRSHNRSMPEEINRLLTDHLSTLLFCPTAQAVRNLAREGIKDGDERLVRKVGDVMYDSVLFYSGLAEKKSAILEELDLFNPQSAIHNPYYLATLHRAENTDNPERLASILKALDKIGRATPVILPLHPRTRKRMKGYRLSCRAVKLIDPVPYLDMLQLEKNALAILTDSGGVQKEAYWLRVPCVTLREETEWMETVQDGWNVLAGTSFRKIMEGVKPVARRRLPGRSKLFGDGRAGMKIVEVIARMGRSRERE